jgi:carbamoyltransferase
MRFLGISPCHDSSICIINDGNIEVFLKEERISKKKRDYRPILSLQKGVEDLKEVESFIFAPAAEGSYDQYFQDWVHIVGKYVNVKNNIDASSQHHLQHASLAFYNSGFEDAAIIVADGAGSYVDGLQELESIFYASYPDNFIPVYKNFEKKIFNSLSKPLILNKYPDCEVDSFAGIGLVGMYCSATGLIGESPLENGKTMGLSAYGEKSNIPNFILNNSNIINSNYFIDVEIEKNNSIPIYSNYYFVKTKNINEKNYKLYADYAFHVQKQTEDAMEFLIKKAVEKTNCKNICITGGYGLNVVANSRFIKNFPEINFYFEPIADDSGNSIGSAMLAYRKLTKDKTINKINNLFFHGKNYDLLKDDTQKIEIANIVDILLDQKSVCIYYKLSEAGPRALGHRSILFDPRNLNAKNLINIIKKREWYRPFASVCLEEDAHKYFYLKNNDGYKFMTINADAKDIAKEIPGVLHVDNTCRIQIIEDESEPLFQLLLEFKKNTGVGVLLNTSFNLAGEPLVETPEDAIKTYKESNLYCLWFPEIGRAMIKN